MRKLLIVIGMVLLFSGCSLSHYGGKSPIEREQAGNPETWKEVYKMQATLWPLEMKVNDVEKKVNEIEKKVTKIEKTVNEIEKTVNAMRDELATTKLSSIQANNDIVSLQAEIQQKKSESISKEKPSIEVVRPLERKNKTEVPIRETIKAVSESKKINLDIKSKTINDIQYQKVSDQEDKVLIYVNAVNNPKLQRLLGANPRLVLDFFNARTMGKERYEIKADGNFIKRIRIQSYQEPEQKVRVVLDMVPNKKYFLDQKFSKKEKSYSFELKAD